MSELEAIVVEDTFDDTEVISAILRHHHFNVFSASNGDEALALLQSVMPTVIVTDLAMPHRDGWQLLVAIRSNAALAHIPVVAVTAYHSAEVAEEAQLQGFDGYFPKPLDPQHFIEQLQQIIGGY